MEIRDQLIVRACKSKDPSTRLRSVYKRFYLMDNEGYAPMMNPLLIEIVQRYELANIYDIYTRLIQKLALKSMVEDEPVITATQGKISETDMLWYETLVGLIRTANIDKFPEIRRPLWVRIRLAEKENGTIWDNFKIPS